MYHFCCQNCQYSHQFQSYQPGQQLSCPRCQTPFTLPNESPSEARAQIDLRLEILEKIGEGGMGLVFRARDRTLGREGALKVLRREVADEERIQRFFREARITARLDHPTIPPVYQVGQTINGDHFILMKLIAGTTLQELLLDHHSGSPEALDQRQLLEVLIKVSHAVEYAHQRDVIHRDLKPENIMVGEFGDVTVMDWGIAKDIQATASSDDLLLNHPSAIQLNPSAALEAGLTQAGSIMGTPGYMSPEQVTDSSQVDMSTDIYALGAILSEILTGFPPVEGHSMMDKMIHTLKGQIIYPIERSTQVPMELDSLVRSCLAADPRERLSSASYIIAELSAYLAQEELSVYHYSLGERLKRYAAGHPKTLLTLVFTLFALTFALIIALLFQSSYSVSSPKEVPIQDNDRVVEQLVIDAESDAKRGKFQSMRRRLEDALRLKKSEALLKKAASLARQVNDPELARSFLKESIASYPPGYQALFTLHTLDLESTDKAPRLTESTNQILELAKARNELNKPNPCILVSRALAAQKSRKYSEAIQFYTKAIQLDSDNPWYYVGRALLLIQARKQDQALADFTKAIELSPKARFYTSRGNIFEGRKDFEKALRDYTTAIQLDPKLSRAFESRAYVYSAMKQFDKALIDFERAIELGANSISPYTQRAKIFANKKDINAVLKSYSDGILKFPSSGRLYYFKGDILRQTGRFKEAVPELKRAAELLQGKEKADAFNLLGFSLTSLKKYKEAILYYSQAIQHNPKLAVAYYNRGLVTLTSGGDKQKVLSDYSICLKLEPKTKIARLDRAKLYVSLNQKQNAYNDLIIFAKNFPNDWDGHYSLGQVSNGLGRYNAALKSYNRAIQLNPKNLDIYYYRATTLFVLNRDKDALADLNRVIKSKPNYQLALYNRSQIYFRQKKYRNALTDLTLLSTKAPKAAKIYLSRGKVFLAMKQYRLARQDFEKVLQLAPNHPQAKDLRVKIAKLKKIAP